MIFFQRKRGKPQKNLFLEIVGILIFAGALFSILTLITYYPNDPSLFSNVTGKALNACGVAGAYLASTLLNGLGLSAFLIPAALFFMAATLHHQEGTPRVISVLGGMTASVIALTVFLTLQWKYWPYSGTLILTGGVLGAWIADVLVQSLNPIGASILSLVVFALMLVISTPVQITRSLSSFLYWGTIFSWKTSRFLFSAFFVFSAVLAMKILPKLYEKISLYIQERSTNQKEEITVTSEVIQTRNSPARNKKRNHRTRHTHHDKNRRMETASNPFFKRVAQKQLQYQS